MRFSDLVGVTAYRVSALRYYATGFSPIGSRLRAGRFNRLGVSAMYFSLEPETALAEYWRSASPRPAVIIAAHLDAYDLIDLRVGKGLKSHWRSWRDDWEAARDALEAGDPNADCASWQCHDDALARKSSGIIFPSTQSKGGKGANVVIYPDHSILGRFTMSLCDPAKEIAIANPVIKKF